jgi:hypothetical protein
MGKTCIFLRERTSHQNATDATATAVTLLSTTLYPHFSIQNPSPAGNHFASDQKP